MQQLGAEKFRALRRGAGGKQELGKESVLLSSSVTCRAVGSLPKRLMAAAGLRRPGRTFIKNGPRPLNLVRRDRGCGAN
jgi:hypothetical protein